VFLRSGAFSSFGTIKVPSVASRRCVRRQPPQAFPEPPPGVEVGSVLNACLEAFDRIPGGTAGWSLVSAVCDAHQASFTWRRASGALATAAPPGARVTADLRTAQTVIPLSPIHCVPDGRTRQARMEVALSDWAVREHERWRAGGAVHPTLSIEGIVPSWELSARACVRTVDVRWTHTGIWQMDSGGGSNG